MILQIKHIKSIELKFLFPESVVSYLSIFKSYRNFAIYDASKDRLKVRSK